MLDSFQENMPSALASICQLPPSVPEGNLLHEAAPL